MAQFFINRPVFAWVLSIVIMLAGAMSIFTLPLEQYPDIAPTSISVNATYTGASAKTVRELIRSQTAERKVRIGEGGDQFPGGGPREVATGTNLQLSVGAAIDHAPDAAAGAVPAGMV